MFRSDEQPKLEITESNLDLSALLEALECDDELVGRINRALIVFLPTDLSPEIQTLAFPDGTREVFRYFQNQIADSSQIEPAVSEHNYREFALLHEIITLPSLYVASITILPLAINLLGSFIYDRLTNRDGSDSKYVVKSEIQYTDTDGNSRSLKYEGPASSFEKVASDFIRQTDELNQRE